MDFETKMELARERREYFKKWDDEYNIYRNENNKENFTQKEEEEQKYDSVYTMEMCSAVVLYIVVMVGGAIFNDRWLIWIVATFIFLKYLFRHDIKTK